MAVESKIRSLHADEIECRVGSIGEKGISLLLYKNARVDRQSWMKSLAYMAGREAI